MHLLRKQVRKWYANKYNFQLRPLVNEKVLIAGNSLNILTSIARKDTNPFHPLGLCPSKHLTTQLYLISHTKKTMCAYNLSTKIQHYCIFLIHQERKQPYKAVIYDGLFGQ